MFQTNKYVQNGSGWTEHLEKWLLYEWIQIKERIKYKNFVNEINE
jgi:hypothetical protein